MLSDNNVIFSALSIVDKMMSHSVRVIFYDFTSVTLCIYFENSYNFYMKFFKSHVQYIM